MLLLDCCTMSHVCSVPVVYPIRVMHVILHVVA